MSNHCTVDPEAITRKTIESVSSEYPDVKEITINNNFCCNGSAGMPPVDCDDIAQHQQAQNGDGQGTGPVEDPADVTPPPPPQVDSEDGASTDTSQDTSQVYDIDELALLKQAGYRAIRENFKTMNFGGGPNITPPAQRLDAKGNLDIRKLNDYESALLSQWQNQVDTVVDEFQDYLNKNNGGNVKDIDAIIGIVTEVVDADYRQIIPDSGASIGASLKGTIEHGGHGTHDYVSGNGVRRQYIELREMALEGEAIDDLSIASQSIPQTVSQPQQQVVETAEASENNTAVFPVTEVIEPPAPSEVPPAEAEVDEAPSSPSEVESADKVDTATGDGNVEADGGVDKVPDIDRLGSIVMQVKSDLEALIGPYDDLSALIAQATTNDTDLNKMINNGQAKEELEEIISAISLIQDDDNLNNYIESRRGTARSLSKKDLETIQTSLKGLHDNFDTIFSGTLNSETIVGANTEYYLPLQQAVNNL